MERDRLAAFSDGVIAIIITVMVLELKAPHATDLDALKETAPAFLSYVLSFVYVAIYWNNHHHFFHLVHRVNGAMLSAIAWFILQTVIIRAQGSGSAMARALGHDLKGKISPVFYIGGIVLAFVDTRISHAFYVLVALMWLVPDRRIERAVKR